MIPPHKYTPAILLLMFAGIILLQRIKLYEMPLHGDICAYGVIGHEMMHGRQLYSDLWERKPPLLYATFAAAELIAGYGHSEIFLLGTATALASLLLIYLAGNAAGSRPTAGLFAAALWVLLNCDLDMAANQPDPETFINTCMIAAVLLLLRWQQHRSLARAVLLGAILSLATLYKHNLALACFALLLGHLLIPRPKSPIQRRLGESIVAGCVMIAVWLTLFGYFAANGRAHDFVDVLFHQNISYSGNVAGNVAESVNFSRFFPPFMIWAIAPIGAIAVLFLFTFRDRKKHPESSSHWLILLAWSIGTFFTVALTGHIFPHYYQLWIPIGCIAGGWAFAGLIATPRRVPPVIGYATLTIAFLFLGFRQGSEFLLTPTQWAQQQFPYFNLVAQNQLGEKLGALLKPNQQFWELGEDNALYFFSKHSPPSGLLFIDPLIYGDETQAYWNRLFRDLDRTKPALVVLSDNWTPFFAPDSPIFPWLAKNYSAWNTPLGWPHYQLLVRHGSDLERGLTPATASWSAPPAAGESSLPAHR